MTNNKDRREVDRNWLRKLLLLHSSDSRLANHRKLCCKYPILKNKALAVAPMVCKAIKNDIVCTLRL